MSKTSSLGAWGEDIAEDYLRAKGYRTLARNWSCAAGEVDIVMRHDDEIVFVEVRLRSKTSYGAGLDTVAWQKQRKLIKTAQWYLQKTRQEHIPVRFDVVSIEHEDGQNPHIEYIEHAFET